MKHAFAVLLLAACSGPAKILTTPVAGTELKDFGAASAVVELGDATYVFDAKRVAIVRNGVIVSTGAAPIAVHSATTIAAPDGEGRWVVALGSDGSAWRVTQEAAFERVEDRLGLTGTKIVDLIGIGKTIAASLATGVAYTTDGHHMSIVTATPPTGELAVARDRLAYAAGSTIQLWDLAKASSVTFALPGLREVGFLDADGAAPRLVAATADAVFAESGGSLRKLATPTQISRIAVAGSRVWIGTASGLFLYDGHNVSRASASLQAPRPLYGSASGGVWLVDRSTLSRFTIAIATNAVDSAWSASIAPVFQRVCSHCHLPGGDAGIDLSTAASWTAEKNEIKDRVLVTKTMPPAGTDMSEADRRMIEAWLTK